MDDLESTVSLHETFRQLFVEDRDELDIFQMCSFVSGLKGEGIGINSLSKYSYYLKAIICVIFQTIVLTLAIIQYYLSSPFVTSDSSIPTDWFTRFTAFIASAYMSSNIWTQLNAIDNQGLYQIDSKTFKNCPPYLNISWIYLGIYTNFITYFIAFIGSNVLILFSPSGLDVILNCLTVHFMLLTDNDMVGRDEYKMIKNWYNRYYDNKYNECNLTERDHSSYSKCCYKITFNLFMILILLFLVSAFIIPWWIGFGPINTSWSLIFAIIMTICMLLFILTTFCILSKN